MNPLPRTLPLLGLAALLCATGCDHRRTPAESDILNPQAALPASLRANALDGRVITSSVDRAQHTMSTLTGNDIAVDSARAATAYPEGALLTLATWYQRDDPHWFGARIPGTPKTVETVSITRTADGQLTPTYLLFAGNPLVAVSPTDPTEAAARRDAILAERPSPMP
jgi:hypothetical protein